MNNKVNPISSSINLNTPVSINYRFDERNKFQKNRVQFKEERQNILSSRVENNMKSISYFNLNSISNVITRIKLKSFLKQIINKLTTRMQKNLSNKQFYLINDRTSNYDNFYQYQLKSREPLSKLKDEIFFRTSTVYENTLKRKRFSFKGFFHQLCEQFSSCNLFKILAKLNIIKPFEPMGLFKFFWDQLQLIFVLILIFIKPLQIVFDKQLIIQPEYLYIFKVGILLDLPVQFNSAYYELGALVNNYREIFLNFFQNDLFYDLISIIALFFDFIIYEENKNVGLKILILLLFLTRIRKIPINLKKIEERYSLSRKAMYLIQLVKLLIIIIIISHIFSTIWLFLGIKYQFYQENTWIKDRNIQNEQWHIQYLSSYYFITTTMVTVGYGDIGPTNNKETLFCIITMYITCGVFAYSLNAIGFIVEDLYLQENDIKNNMFVINKYMHKKNISNSLQYSIREYLDYIWRENNQNDLAIEQKILSQLNDNLKQNLLLEANKIVLLDSPLFINNFSEKLIQKTTSIIYEKSCTPEETIFLEGEGDENFIYFIERGKVEILIDISNIQETKLQTLKTLKKGDSFGMQSFFTAETRQFSVRSLEFTTLLYIRREDFIQLLQQYPEDYEKFCYLKDSLTLQQRYDRIFMNCFSCNSQQHLMIDCPFIHFKANKVIYIYFIYLKINKKNNLR